MSNSQEGSVAATCAWCGKNATDGVALEGRRFCSPQCAGRLTGSLGEDATEPGAGPESEPTESGGPGGDETAQNGAQERTEDAKNANQTEPAPDSADGATDSGDGDATSAQSDGADRGDEPAATDPTPVPGDGHAMAPAADAADASDGSDTIDTADTSTWPKPIVDGTTVPESLQDMEIWALWSPAFGKTPMAPWETGHMYPAAWGADTPADERPEVTYPHAKALADLDPASVHANYPFPSLDDEPGDDPHIPDTLYPTILLPHDPPDPPIMQVDFDDVRDPETGAVSPEVVDIIKRLDGYTEVSQSGWGLHTFVRAELPGALGKFIADLDTVGHIELYDHGRFVGCTWNHLGGTPPTVPERQDVVDELVHEYETDALRDRRTADAAAGQGGSAAAGKARDELDDIRNSFDTDGSGSSDRSNAYYQLGAETTAAEGSYNYSKHSNKSRDWSNGPHPAHGPESSDVSDCTNFGIKDDGWSCFACGTGGGGLALFAVCVTDVKCRNVDSLHDDPALMLETCLKARDAYPHLDDDEVTPPYTALVGVAKQFDLSLSDPDGDILGEQTHRIAEQIYHEMELGDLE